jgi:hypothetical protein
MSSHCHIPAHTQVRAEKDALAKKLKVMESKILKVW